MSPQKIFQSLTTLTSQANICSVVLVIFAGGLTGCETGDRRQRSVNAIPGQAELERLGVPNHMRPLCEETMRVRLAMYDATKARQQAKLDQLGETRKGLLAKTRTPGKRLAEGSTEASAEYEQARKSLQWADLQRARILNARKAADRVAGASFGEIANTVSAHDTQIEMICRVTDTGRVDCVALASLLATYDQYMDEAILSDIETLINLYGLDRAKDTLLSCGRAWGAYDKKELLGAAHGAEGSATITAESRDRMLELCQELSSGGSGGQGGLGGGGFSGITGLDSFQCADAGKPSSGGGDLFEHFEKMIDVLMEDCEASLVPTEGGDDTKAGSTPADGDKKDKEDDTKKDVKEKKSETKQNEDGTTTSTTTTEYADGSIKTEWVTQDENGKVTRTITKVESVEENGVKVIDVGVVDDQGNSSYVEISESPDGTKVGNGSKRDSSGNTTHFGWVKTKDGHVAAWSKKPFSEDPVRRRWRTIKGDCLESACTDCRDYASLLPEVFGECANSLGASYPCRASGGAAGCCESMLGDPRILTPDPDGSYQCGGGIGNEAKKAACESKCGVAENEDCGSQCESFEGLKGVKFNVLDSICRYAISEECVSSGPVIQFPFKGKTPTNGVKPPTSTGPITAPRLPPSIEKHIPFSEHNLGEPLGVLIPKGKGYSAEVDQLREAAKSGIPSLRRSALELLAEWTGPDAIPILRVALGDPDLDVRIEVARLLAAFSDESGIRVLRQSLLPLAPRKGEPDPNMVETRDSHEWRSVKDIKEKALPHP